MNHFQVHRLLFFVQQYSHPHHSRSIQPSMHIPNNAAHKTMILAIFRKCSEEDILQFRFQREIVQSCYFSFSKKLDVEY